MSQRHSSGPEGAPIGGSGGRGIMLLAVAVVLGIVVLQASDTGGGGEARVTTETSVNPATTSTLPTNTSLPPPRPAADVRILPANGTQVSGLGGRVATVLKDAGYTNTLSPVDSTTPAETSLVEYSSPEFASDAIAVAVILQLPATAVQLLTTPVPVPDTRGAEVVVVAGNDLASLSSSEGATTTTG